MNFVLSVRRLYQRVFVFLDRIGWLLPTLARFIFLAVLFLYFWNSAMTKLGDGFWGFLEISDGAYFQIVPGAMEAAGYQIPNVGFEIHLIVFLGTWAEIVLPVLLVLGLFTRLASLGMFFFIAVLHYVDVTMSSLKPEVIGSLFDGSPHGYWDEHILWALLVLVPLLKGPGPISLDFILGRLLQKRAERSVPVEIEPPAAPSEESAGTPQTSR